MAQKQIASIVEWQVQESRLVKFFYLLFFLRDDVLRAFKVISTEI